MVLYTLSSVLQSRIQQWAWAVFLLPRWHEPLTAWVSNCDELSYTPLNGWAQLPPYSELAIALVKLQLFSVYRLPTG